MSVRCPTCGTWFPSIKAQNRHSVATRHAPLMCADLAKLVAKHPRCTWCDGFVKPDAVGKDEWMRPTREHLKPKSQGGSAGKKNIAVAHLLCNQMRANMDEDGFRRLMHGEAVTREELWPWLFTSSASEEPRSSPPTASGEDQTSGISTGTKGRRRRSRRATSPSSPAARSLTTSTSTPTTTPRSTEIGRSPDARDALS